MMARARARDGLVARADRLRVSAAVSVLLERTEADMADDARSQKIAVPVTAGVMADHFGHCDAFFIAETDPERSCVTRSTVLPAPEHRPGYLPGWLAEHGVDVVIAGGMGWRAQESFRQGGIDVVVGARSADPMEVVQAYLDGTLTIDGNRCDH